MRCIAPLPREPRKGSMIGRGSELRCGRDGRVERSQADKRTSGHGVGGMSAWSRAVRLTAFEPARDVGERRVETAAGALTCRSLRLS